MPNPWEYIKAELVVLKGAPLSVLGLAIAFCLLGVGVGEWHYGERLEAKDEQIHRYRVSLGIDKASSNAMVELTNKELQEKAESLVSKTRSLCDVFHKKDANLEAQLEKRKASEDEHSKEHNALAREYSEQFDRTVRSDFLNVENEILGRLDPKATAAVMKAGPPLSNEATGSRFGLSTLLSAVGSEFGTEAVFLCQTANELEQLSKLLPPDK
jgi:hypothetical protein